MDQQKNLTRCTLIVNDSQSESNNNIDHSIIGVEEAVSKDAITQNVKQKEKFGQTEINAIFQNLQSNQTSSMSPKHKSFSKLLIYFHSTKYANKMLQLIRPNEKFSKKHFKIIDDSASSYKHMKKRTHLATNMVSQNLNLIDFRVKLRMKVREFQSLLKQKFLLYFSLIPLIEPQSKFKLLWDFLLSIMRMYMIVCMPIVISFHSKDSEQYHCLYIILTCLFFIFDIILRAFTICYDKGLPLKDKFELIKRQFTLSTFMELFSIFCGIIIALSFLSEQESPYILEEDGWPRMALLLFYQQIMNILQYFDTIQHQLKLSKLSNSFIELLKLVFLILLIQHFCCCLWVVIGEYKQRQDTINWLKRVEGEPWQNVYLESFYFMIGYGEIVPTNPIEKIFCICYMFLSTMQLSFSVNTIGTILTQIKENNEKIRQKMTCINEYMREKQISQSLQYKVREYFNFYWEQEVIQKRNEQSDLIQLLPEELQNNLKIESAQVLMSKCQFFKQFFSQKCLHQLLDKVEFKSYQPGIVIENNDLNIFIIEQGLVEVKQQKRQLCYLKDNDYFGHLEMKSNQSSALQYKTASFCSILIIPNQGIREVLQQNENDQEQYQKIKDISYCYVCQDKTHLSNECYQVHFVPDKEKVIKQYNFIQEQFRDCFRRSNKRHHFSASQDLELISNSAKIYQIENDQIIEQIVPTIFYEQKQSIQELEECYNYDRFNQSENHQRKIKYKHKASGSQNMIRAQTIDILINDNGMKEMHEQIKQKYENIHKYTQQQQKDLQMLYKQLSNKGEENSETCDKIQNLRYNKEWNLENIVKKVNRCQKQEFQKSTIEQFQKYMMFPNQFVSLYKNKKIPTQEDQEKLNASVFIQQYKQSKFCLLSVRSKKPKEKKWENCTLINIQYKLMNDNKQKDLESPIFAVVCFPDSVLVSLGGGGKKYGLVNSLQLFPKPIYGILKDPIHTLQLGDEIFQRLRLNTKTGLIVGNSDDQCVILKVQDNKISIVTKFQTDRAAIEPCQNDGVFKLLGGYFGHRRRRRNFEGLEQGLSIEIHSGYERENLIIRLSCSKWNVATDNEECKILKDSHVLHKLDISSNNIHKLQFQSALFSLDGTTIFTFKNPMRGASYMTSWRIENDNIKPLKTIKIHGHPVVSTCQSKEGIFIGIGCSDGTVKIINARKLDIESSKQAHELPCTALCFTPDSRFIISGSVDAKYHFLQNTRPQGMFSLLSKFWLLGMLLAYLIIVIKDLFE
ncbi:unnamed protein product (macronuclear) [Paramecium tetraurelia]|uniref:Cyclic nucleotide-binding domain-containing protein n=1 Tax=Paramecium tetraurelia TaxID=5888 RepID=A0CEX3_PARTE|nr:uncharacterized protein GSPATT00037779001 [Paramecium tetraurelia]CAK69340.1 unnamed protein product [Paramecium tetraurelia]|eukprot:XP_001436737.1 hypothetical protein (macronuclear) [Paramecium tetraurelia strain d4-2]